jgi:hypothetical protein
VKNVSIEILALDLTLLQSLLPTTLTNEDNIVAVSVNFIVPNVPFRLKVNAHLDNNNNNYEQIERFNPKVYIPTTIQTTLSTNQSSRVNIGETFAFEIQVKALGKQFECRCVGQRHVGLFVLRRNDSNQYERLIRDTIKFNSTQ